MGLDLPGRQRPEAGADHGGGRGRAHPRRRLPARHDPAVRDHRRHRPGVHAPAGRPAGRAAGRPRLLQRLHPVLRRHRHHDDHPAGDVRGPGPLAGRGDDRADRHTQRDPRLRRAPGGLRTNREHPSRARPGGPPGRLPGGRGRRPVRRRAGDGGAARRGRGDRGDRGPGPAARAPVPGAGVAGSRGAVELAPAGGPGPHRARGPRDPRGASRRGPRRPRHDPRGDAGPVDPPPHEAGQGPRAGCRDRHRRRVPRGRRDPRARLRVAGGAGRGPRDAGNPRCRVGERCGGRHPGPGQVRGGQRGDGAGEDGGLASRPPWARSRWSSS